MTSHALSAVICPTCEEAPRTLRGDLRVATLALVIEDNNKLREALRLALRWMGDPADAMGTFEDIGEWFYRDTGFLRPGKSEPLECGGRDEERQAAWNEWTKRTRAHVREAALTALRVSGGSDG